MKELRFGALRGMSSLWPQQEPQQEAPQEESGAEAAPQIAQDAPARRRRRQPGLQIIRSQQAK